MYRRAYLQPIRAQVSNFKSVILIVEVVMSLITDLAGGVLGALTGSNAAEGGQGGLLQVAMDLIQKEGGLTGLIQKFQDAGLAEQVASWVGTGANVPINADQLKSVLGDGALGTIVSQLGLNQEQVSSGLAQVLPALVDKLTPNGTTEGVDALLQQGLTAVMGMLGGEQKPA